MRDDPETRLFTRFRDGSDVAALGELYDLTAAELLRVAMHLVRDPARAEDLVQQTFVAAIEAAPRFDPTRSARAWLLGILANLARKLQRAEARVPVAGDEVAVDPAAVAASAEFTEQVDAAIDTVAEVYRPVLVLHLKHGMIAAEIAHALRRPPGTVRTQLVRGLELLKKALPASLALGAALLFTPMRGLAAMKQAVLANAASHVATAAATAGVAAGVGTLSLGGTVLMKKLIAAAALVALAITARFLWVEIDTKAPEVPPGRGNPAVVSAPLPSPDPDATPAAVATKTTREPAPPVPTHGSLRYRFLWESDRTPAVGVFVRVVVWNRPNPMASTIDLPTDANGDIALAALEPGNIGVYLDRHDGVFRDIAAGEEATATYLIPRGVTADVTVQDERGQPIPNARVWLSEYGNGTEGHEVETTGAAGRATVRDIGEGRALAVRAAGHAPSRLLSVTGKPGERKEAVFTLAAKGAALRGRVRNADGEPCPGARVWIGGFVNVEAKDQAKVNGFPPPFELTADDAGAFLAMGLPAGAVMLRVRATGSGTFSTRVVLADGETRDVDVRLMAEAIVRGFVRDEQGHGVARAGIGGGATYGDFGHCSTISLGDGSFTLRGLTSGRAELGASKEPFLSARQALVLAEGEQRTLDFVLRGSKTGDQIRGVLVDERGAPRPKWIVSMHDGQQTIDAWRAWLRTDKEGRFVATGCKRPGCRLEVFDPDGAASVFPLLAMDGLAPGGDELRLVVPDTALRFGAFTGVVVDAAGKPVGDASISAREPGSNRANVFTTDASGRFRAARVPARHYRLEVRAPGHPALALGEREALPDRDIDLGTVVLPRGGRLTVRCTGEVVASMRWAVAGVFGGDVAHVTHLDLDAKPKSTDLLAPGSYELRVVGDGIAAARHAFAIADGSDIAIDVALARGAMVEVEVREARAAAWTQLDVSANDEQGRCVWGLGGFTRRGNERCTFATCLGVGTWQVVAKTDTGLGATATVHIADLAAPPPPVVLELR